MNERSIALGIALLIAAAMPLAAQDLEPEEQGPPAPPRIFVGGTAEYGRAVGEFATYVRDGGGLSGHLVFPLSRNGPVSLRLAGHGMIYGSETRRYTLLPGIGADVTTNNEIAGLMAGPQITAGPSGVKGYAFGGIGFSYFATTSSVSGSGSASTFASSINFDDVTFAGEAGAGLLIRFGRSRVWGDIGVRYLANGRVSYVTRQGVSVSGNTLVVNPVTSDANMVIYHIGVTVGLAPRAGGRVED